ncbi:MAG TPA: hypothetical protein VKA01_06220 [Vicinamibacteria bacterium]|nr:hypothetical protein [Vicinamibacteria bacterium]
MFLGMTLVLPVTASDSIAGPSVRLDPDPALLERWPDRFARLRSDAARARWGPGG